MRNELDREGGKLQYKHWFQTVVTEVYFFDVFPFPQNYQTISRTIGQRAAICSVRFTFEKIFLQKYGTACFLWESNGN
jgi:hypothetical protein